MRHNRLKMVGSARRIWQLLILNNDCDLVVGEKEKERERSSKSDLFSKKSKAFLEAKKKTFPRDLKLKLW